MEKSHRSTVPSSPPHKAQASPLEFRRVSRLLSALDAVLVPRLDTVVEWVP